MAKEGIESMHVRASILWRWCIPVVLCLMPVALGRSAVAAPVQEKVETPRGAQLLPSRERPREPYRRKIALVVGIDLYSNGIPPLNYAVSDAEAVGHVLEVKFGFDVRLLVNEQAKKEALISAVISLHDQMSKDDQLLVFFAGHGKSFGEGAQESGYILPYDAVEGAEDVAWSRGISMTELVSRIMKLPPKHVLILLDTCFGGYAAMSARGSMEDNPEQLLRRLTSLPARHLLSAGKRGQPVMESASWRHSAFVAELLSGLEGAADRNRDGLIPVSELYTFLQGAVTRRTKGAQTPHLATLDEGQGEFVFIARPRWRPSFTREGVRRKALIASPEVPLYRSSYSTDARETFPLNTYFLFEGEENRRIPVSLLERSEGPDGWLPVGSFLEWNSFEVALMAPSKDGANSLFLFADRSCALRVVDERDVGKCASIPLPPILSSSSRVSLVIPLLDRWGEAYRGIVIPLRPVAKDERDPRRDPPGYLIGWLPRKRGGRQLIQEAVFLRRKQALILTNLIDTLSLASTEVLEEGSESFARKVSSAISAITGQVVDPADPLDVLLARAAILPFRTTTLSFSLEEIVQWKPADFLRLHQILERKVEALRSFLLDPKNVYIFNERDHVFIPRDLFP